MKINFYFVLKTTRKLWNIFFFCSKTINFDHLQSSKAKWEGLLKPGEGELKKTENSKYQLDNYLK